MKKILILLITFTFATELEVDGSLKVTGGIDAQGQPISNVGNPVNANDAIPMSAVGGVVSNAMSLAGMNPPERIYRWQYDYNGTDALEVPLDKIWKLSITPRTFGHDDHSCKLIINQYSVEVGNQRNGATNTEIWVMPGDLIEFDNNWKPNYIGIFEYSFTSTGTSQGMDYVEP